MQRFRVRRTALAVAVLSAVGAAALETGVGPTGVAAGADPAGSALTAAADGTTGVSGSSGQSGASGATSDTGASGATGTTGSTAETGPSGTTGASGSTGDTGASGATGASGSTGDTGVTGVSTGATASSGTTGTTGPPTATTGTSGASGASGTTGATGATQAPDTNGGGATGATGLTGTTTPVSGSVGGLGSGSSGKHRRHRHKHHRHRSAGAGTVPIPPSIVGLSTQPPTGAGPSHPSRGGRGGNGKAGGRNAGGGDVAPPPSLFAGWNPLAGVLPGSWNDPFIVPGGTAVPQFFVDTFRIPPFLLSIYQAAGTAYGIPWQVLAAINEVETDYGTNLDTSSAGAIGWMQFLPSTWQRYAVDASGTGKRDPYNAADAIFAAARYLAAAGGAGDLPGAVYAYNHSWGYVKSVLARAEEFGGEPSTLVQSVTELAEGDFPVQLSYHAGLFGHTGRQRLRRRVGRACRGGAPPAPPVRPRRRGPLARRPRRRRTALRPPTSTPIVTRRSSPSRTARSSRSGTTAGSDASCDSATASVTRSPTATSPRCRRGTRRRRVARARRPCLRPRRPRSHRGPRPNGSPASAGSQQHGRTAARSLFVHTRARSRAPKQRARPSAKATPRVVTPRLAAVATLNLASSFSPKQVFTPIDVLVHAARQPSSSGKTSRSRHGYSDASLTSERRHVHHASRPRPPLMDYFTGAFGISPRRLELERLVVGAHVLAGTVIGRLANTSRPHLAFELRPAADQTAVDPRPFLDSWSQLATLELHRRGLAELYYGPDAHDTSAGAIKVMSQIDLAREVLQDGRVALPRCERSAITSGSVTRPVLASLELLSLHGIDSLVGGGWCKSSHGSSTTPPLLRTGNAVALTPVGATHTSAQLATAAARALSPLRPAISTTTVPGKVVISFAPVQQPQALAASVAFTSGFALSTNRWAALDARLAQISEPRVPTAISPAALTDPRTRRTRTR